MVTAHGMLENNDDVDIAADSQLSIAPLAKIVDILNKRFTIFLPH